MDHTIHYKGYTGSIEFSDEDGLFCGKVLGIRSLISYEGKLNRNLSQIFRMR